MKKLVYLIWLLLMSITVSAFASSVSVDKASAYSRGMEYFELKLYSQATEQFLRASGYKDSESWKLYSEAFDELRMADLDQEQGYRSSARAHIDKASGNFLILAAQQFQDSESMRVYCSARLYELDDMQQSAIDLYSQLPGTHDSISRFIRLRGGYASPTQAPLQTFPPKIEGVPAHAERSITTYLGPGSQFMRQTIASVNSHTELSILGEYEGHYFIEVKTETGYLRCFALKTYILRDGTGLIKTLQSNTNAILLQNTEGFLGPGEDYLQSGVTIPAGTRVQVLNVEETFSMIEFTPENLITWAIVYVPTNLLGI